MVDADGFISFSFNLEQPQERTWWANALRMRKVGRWFLLYVAYSGVSEPFRVENIQFKLHKTDILRGSIFERIEARKKTTKFLHSTQKSKIYSKNRSEILYNKAIECIL